MMRPFILCQRCKGQSHQFSKLLQELRCSETDEYSACVLAFINCLIASSDTLEVRVHLRNELVGELS